MIELECIKDNRVIFKKEIENKISSLTKTFSYLNLIGIDSVKVSSGSFESTLSPNVTKQKLAEVSLDISNNYSGLIDQAKIEEKLKHSVSHTQAIMMSQRISPSLLGNRMPADFAKDYNRVLSLS